MSIFGRNPVLEALKAKRPINKVLIAKDSSRHGVIAEIIHLAKKSGIVVENVPKKLLDKLSENQNHQGVFAKASPKAYVDLDTILKKKNLFLIILDGIEDPHNLGAIIRTADAAGASGVVIPKRRAAGLTDIVAKASAGAIEHMPVAQVTNLNYTIESLKEQGIRIVGVDQDGEKSYNQADFSGPLALVIGSEGNGISRLVKEHCDLLVKIPMLGKISSLNASVAAGVVMYEVVRQGGNGTNTCD